MVNDIRPPGPADESKTRPEEQFPGAKPDPIERPDNPSLVDDNAGGLSAISLQSKSPGGNASAGKEKSWKEKFFSRGLKLWPHTKKQKNIGIATVAGLLVVGMVSVYALNKILKKPFEISNASIIRDPKTTVPSRLTGVEIPIKLNERHVTSIMIENSPDARPQSGLYEAGVVFEAIAEGGITRFNALYLESMPGYIGPIRSVRPYYVSLVAPFHPSFVHAGGSAQGLASLKQLKINDIDHGANAAAFQRVSSRVAPHNLYSSMAALDKVTKARKYKSGDFESWPRNRRDKPAEKAKAAKIDFNISGPLYNVHYDYNKKSNSYKRRMAGKPHVDEKAKKQMNPKVVIALVMKYSKAGIYSVYHTGGSGDMYVFQNGSVVKGRWQKSGPKSQFKFVDKDGNDIKLNPGQTWVTLFGSNSQVKYGS